MPVTRVDASGQNVGEEGISYYADAAGSSTVLVSPTNPLPTSPTPASGSVMRVNAGYVAPGQTAKQYAGTTALSTTLTTAVTLETVTTGKTYVITDIAVYSDNATQFEFRLQAAGVDIFRAPVRDISPIQLPGMETQPIATSLQLVRIFFPIVGTATNAWYYISGIEQ